MINRCDEKFTIDKGSNPLPPSKFKKACKGLYTWGARSMGGHVVLLSLLITSGERVDGHNYAWNANPST